MSVCVSWPSHPRAGDMDWLDFWDRAAATEEWAVLLCLHQYGLQFATSPPLYRKGRAE